MVSIATLKNVAATFLILNFIDVFFLIILFTDKAKSLKAYVYFSIIFVNCKQYIKANYKMICKL